ncbi:MAG TPA: hypothetical protein VLG69_02200 [Candidatus Andersenbacteria bacterium]|nr:hypothetical protein [Candidatus Andersenbacteria bacterium]
MNKRQLWIITGLGVVCLLFIGILINIIGNVSIRSNDISIFRIGIHVVSPLTAGSRTVIRWDTPTTIAAQPVMIVLRSKQGITALAETPFFAGTASIQIPCSQQQGSASIELVSSQDKSLIAWDSITINPAGPDCAR